MSQITWREINAPNFSAANALIGRGQEQLSKAAEGFTQGMNNFATAHEKQNTNQLMDMLYSARDPSQFNSESFQNELGALRNSLGKDIDAEKYRNAFDTRLGKLQTDSLNAQAYQDKQDEVYNRPLLAQYYTDLEKGNLEGAQGLLKQMRGNTAQYLMQGVDLRKNLLSMDDIRHGWDMDDKNYRLNKLNSDRDYEYKQESIGLQRDEFEHKRNQDNLAGYGEGGLAGIDANGNTVFPSGNSSAGSVGSPTKYDSLIDGAAKQYGVPSSLIKAMMITESSGNPNAVSPVGARGLMQLMPGTAKEMRVTNPHDPKQSINGGAGYIAKMYNKYGSIPAALAAYNMGPGNYDKYLAGKKKMPAETRKYVANITKAMGAMKQASTPSNVFTSEADMADMVNTSKAFNKTKTDQLTAKKNSLAMYLPYDKVKFQGVTTTQGWAKARDKVADKVGSNLLTGANSVPGFKKLAPNQQLVLLEHMLERSKELNYRSTAFGMKMGKEMSDVEYAKTYVTSQLSARDTYDSSLAKFADRDRQLSYNVAKAKEYNNAHKKRR